MLTDRQMYVLFAEAVVDEPADPTFLDELFEEVREEVRTSGLAAASTRPLGSIRRRPSTWRVAPAWIGLAAAVLMVALAMTLVLRNPLVGPFATPSPTPAPTPTPVPTLPVTPATDLVPFTSRQYAYTVRYPSNWHARSATIALGTNYPFDFSTGVDYFSAGAPEVADPGVIIAAVDVAPGMTLDAWMTNIKELQALQFTCAPPAEQAVAVAGLPATMLTWDSCPVSLRWVGFVQGTVAYDALWIDEFATDNPAQVAADRATFEQILATLSLPPAPLPTGSSAPASP